MENLVGNLAGEQLLLLRVREIGFFRYILEKLTHPGTLELFGIL